jgi:(1->4)-alpha-D-glucan 1-alpha-D-glucosylmutase
MKRIPRATYRLQFNRSFTFQQAREILDYLEELGISDVYASPLFEAGSQSTHGYDICCYGKINSNPGTEEDFKSFSSEMKRHGFGLVLDIVPNHMSASLENSWWLDVLEKGRESDYAFFFDIDWDSETPGSRGKVLLPVLEDDYRKVLEGGKLRLAFQDSKFFVAYHDRNFPVDARTLPPRAEKDPSRTLSTLNGAAGHPPSFDKLDALIQQQHYRPAYWKLAAEEINYRRFFDVAEMVAVRMELPEFFRETHRLIFGWLESGIVTGLRVDHPDGLWAPREYLQRLQDNHSPYVVVEKILSGEELLPDDWLAEGTTGYDFLNRVNGLFVDGSNGGRFSDIYREFTGNKADFAKIAYESRKLVLVRSFVSELNALARRLKGIAVHARSGRDFTFSQLRNALEEIIASFPVYRTYIAEGATEVSARDRETIWKAVGAAQKRTTLSEALFVFLGQVLSLEVGNELEESQKKSVRNFVMKFQQLTGPTMAKGLEDTAFYRFNRLVSLNEVGGDPGNFGIAVDEFHQANSRVAKAWPHTMLATSTHDTKRGEDVRARLNVLSEMPVEWRNVIARWSKLNADKKTLLKNLPAPDANDEYLLYQMLIGAWQPDGEIRENLKSFRERILAFMLKAAKEEKINTSWTEPNEAYEDALRNFVERVLADSGNEAFIEDFLRFQRRVAFFGRINSLAQTLLKIASPGVADFYQGSELWDLNLVDPDNRRPVDYSIRRNILTGLKKTFAHNTHESIARFLQDDNVGAVKLFLIWRALRFRREQREIFDYGEYVPLSALGEKEKHACAFARVHKNRAILVIVPRLVFGLMEGEELQPIGAEVWKKTVVCLAPAFMSRWCNVLTGENVTSFEHQGGAVIEVSHALNSFPVAMLASN